MKCPECQKEMEEGKITAPYCVAWFPPNHQIRRTDLFTLSRIKKLGGTLLAGKSISGYYAVMPAWICRSCQKSIVDWNPDHVTYTLKL